jgi:H+/Cl- antiporter ClcA
MYIIISSIICYAMDKIIKFIFLSDYNILSIYKEALFNNAKIRAKQVRKVLLIKYVLFYIIGIIYIIFSGYYLSIFGAVYRNTQFILIKNIILSYAISSIFPFIIIIIPSLLRRYALKDSTRGWVFNISRYLQYL